MHNNRRQQRPKKGEQRGKRQDIDKEEVFFSKLTSPFSRRRPCWLYFERVGCCGIEGPLTDPNSRRPLNDLNEKGKHHPLFSIFFRRECVIHL